MFINPEILPDPSSVQFPVWFPVAFPCAETSETTCIVMVAAPSPIKATITANANILIFVNAVRILMKYLKASPLWSANIDAASLIRSVKQRELYTETSLVSMLRLPLLIN
jgi:hypothetical protein